MLTSRTARRRPSNDPGTVPAGNIAMMNHLVLSLTVVLTILFRVQPSLAQTVTPIGPNTGCELIEYQNNIYIRVHRFGNPSYQVRIGAGGTINSLMTITNSGQTYEELLAPSAVGESTDRVIQWSWWNWKGAISNAFSGSPWYEWQFNISQAGTQKVSNYYRLSPIMRVETSPSTCAVNVYSTPQDQWVGKQSAALQSRLPTLTRYAVRPEGELGIRRIILSSNVTLHNAKVPTSFDVALPVTHLTNKVATTWDSVLLDSWTPFRRSSFDIMGYNYQNDGTPGWWFQLGYNVPPGYSHENGATPVVSRLGLSGYSFIGSARPGRPAVALVHGRGEPQCYISGKSAPAACNHYYEGMGDFGVSSDVAILDPYLLLSNLPAGFVVDQTLYLAVASEGPTASWAKRLNVLGAWASPPAIYVGPTSGLPISSASVKSDLTAIVNTLSAFNVLVGTSDNRRSATLLKFMK